MTDLVQGKPGPIRFGFAEVVVLLLPLTVIWGCKWLPTQDGPSHVYNAVVLKQLLKSDARYQEVYAIRWELLPNWTSSIVLACLTEFFPPRTAEKVLTTVYVIGFILAYRYFATGLAHWSLVPTLAATLFVFSQAFWMGFYNYCLGLVLLWLTLGFIVRHRDRWGWRTMAVLGALLLAASVTHLATYLLAVGASAVIAWSVGGRRGIATVGLTAVLTCWVPLAYLIRIDFGPVTAALDAAESWLSGKGTGISGWSAVMRLPREWFPHTGRWAASLTIIAALVIIWVIVSELLRKDQGVKNAGIIPRRAVVALAVVTMIAYLTIPEHLGEAGYLKTRFVILPPLLALAAAPRVRPVTFTVPVVGLGACVVAGTWLGWQYTESGNEQIREYTAAVASTGSGRVMYVLQTDIGKRPDCLLHAADYYCLETGHINLDNFQAERAEFPIRFAMGWQRGRGPPNQHPNRGHVSLIIVWNLDYFDFPLPDCKVVHRAGRLTVWTRDP